MRATPSSASRLPRFFQPGSGPPFVGVDDQPGFRGVLADGGDPLDIALSAELDLQQGALPLGGCRPSHRLRGVEAQGVGGGHRPRRRQAGELVHAPVLQTGFQVPEGAVEGVARRPGGQGALQSAAAHATGGQLAAKRFDRGDNPFERLPVTRVRDAFPAARGAVSVGQLDDHYIGGSLGAPGDREAAGDRPALGADPQLEGCHAGSY